MLVLSCKVGEKIVIAENVLISVVAITRNKVRLGIEAPKGVPVDRAEVYRQWTGDDGPPTTWAADT
jgi:carbon storage regulator